MKRKDIIIDALTSKIEDMTYNHAEYSADMESTVERNIDTIKLIESEANKDSHALSLLQSFLMENHKDLIPELAAYVVKEVDEAYDQDERYEYGLRALHDMSEVLGCDGGSPIIDALDKTVAHLQLLNKKSK